MKSKLIEHTISIVLVGALFAALLYSIGENAQKKGSAVDGRLQEYMQLVDFGDPLDRTLFRESLDVFYPDSAKQNAALLQSIEDFRREQFTNVLYKSGTDLRGLTWEKTNQLLLMYLQFIIIYIIVMGLSYYGAQTLGILRFIRMKQNRSSYFLEIRRAWKTRMSFAAFLVHAVRSLLKAIVKGLAYVILFSPAYVIAYSFKTQIATDSNIFMILLGIISNGLLINYANRFYTFLVSESRKGYVETAMVKNLSSSYAWRGPGGLPMASVFGLRKQFPSHVFQHIYMNARHQFQPTLKEHASFLITGLVIIEMALNIQGHLSYEMLKNILYKQYDVVLAIVFGIFLLIKATDIVVDIWSTRELRKYGAE